MFLTSYLLYGEQEVYLYLFIPVSTFKTPPYTITIIKNGTTLPDTRRVANVPINHDKTKTRTGRTHAYHNTQVRGLTDGMSKKN